MKKMIGCCTAAIAYYILCFSTIGNPLDDSFENAIMRISCADVTLDVSVAYFFLEILVFSVIFQLGYGSTIYKNYSGVGVYFFSRTAKRSNWYIREVADIYLKALIYHVCIVCVSLLTSFFNGARNLKKEELQFYVIYLLVWWLYTAGVTLAINTISIMIKGNYGFAIVAMVVLLFISLMFYLGGKYEDELNAHWGYFIWNPMTYLYFGLHSSNNAYLNDLLNMYETKSDLLLMPVYWGGFGVAAIVAGKVTVEKTQLLNFDNEAEY